MTERRQCYWPIHEPSRWFVVLDAVRPVFRKERQTSDSRFAAVALVCKVW